MTQQQCDVVLTDFLIVIGGVLPYILGAGTTVIGDVSRVGRLIAHLTLIVLIFACTRSAAVETKLRLQHETLDGVQLEVTTSEETAALDVTLVGAILVQQRRTVCRVPGVRRCIDGAVI